MAFGPDGALWFELDKGKRIGRLLEQDGPIVTYPWKSTCGRISSMAAGSKDELWITCFDTNRVARLGGLVVANSAKGEKARISAAVSTDATMPASSGPATPAAIDVATNMQLAAPSNEQPQVEATTKPSFDCAKASSNVEKAICSDSLLARLDGALAQNFNHMIASDIGDGAAADLRATQKAWLAQRNKCADKQCLIDLYRTRVDVICEYPVLSGVHPNCVSADTIN